MNRSDLAYSRFSKVDVYYSQDLAPNSGSPFTESLKPIVIFQDLAPNSGSPFTESLKPIVILMHGGSWLRGSKQDWTKWAQTLQREGYVVMVPDYIKLPKAKASQMQAEFISISRWTHVNAR
jgi:acetyl esterase/lipase